MFPPQIPSGYYIQTMNSNLHMGDFLLPIGVMNVISILPLLLLAPLMELVTSCYLAMGKAPIAPVKVISMYFSTLSQRLYSYNLYLNVPFSVFFPLK